LTAFSRQSAATATPPIVANAVKIKFFGRRLAMRVSWPHDRRQAARDRLAQPIKLRFAAMLPRHPLASLSEATHARKPLDARR
jgi:hypothetical protein